MSATSRVYLRQPTRADQEEFIDLMRASRAFHSPWATAPTDDERFSAYLADARRADFEALLLCRASDGKILGFFNLSQIVRRGFQSAYLGYAVGKPFAGQGYMRDGLELGAAPCIHDDASAPGGGQHPADEHIVACARPGCRVQAGGLLPAVPEDRRALARPRAVGDPRRGVANSSAA